jgi:uncharacterized protein GlcG (DUF336 family)
MKLKVSICVLDSSGMLVAFAKMDGADVSTPDIARAKAYTAVAYSHHTNDLVAEFKANPLDANSLISAGRGNVVFIAGGVVAKEGGSVLGGIGISGAEADQDHAIGIEAIS